MIVKILVGNVGTGKSSYMRDHCSDYLIWNDFTMLYMFNNHEIFNPVPEFNETLNTKLKIFTLDECCRNNKNICIEGTHETTEKRKVIIDQIKNVNKNIEIYAVNLGPGNKFTLSKRLYVCKKYDRNKWRDIHNQIKKNYEEPSLKEGFSKIIDDFYKSDDYLIT